MAASFIVTRGRGAPDSSTPPDEVGVHIFYQLWQKRLHPFADLADGDVIYWGDQKSRELRWELRARNVRRAYCHDRNQFEGFLRYWFGIVETDVEYDIGRETGWLLAWENELVRPLQVTLPSGFHYGRTGIKEISDSDRAMIGLPEPAKDALIPVETIDGPVPVFGPSARRNITPALRRAVFERDGRICRDCRTTEGPFHLDHIFPFSKGGPTIERNLQVLCASCNLSKGAHTEQDDIPEQLLPDSALERLIVSSGRPRPDTVKEASEQLESMLNVGDISVEEAGLAALETVTDLENDWRAADDLSAAIRGRRKDDKRRVWGDLLEIVPHDPNSEAYVIENIDSFERILGRDDVAANVAAALLAPFIADAEIPIWSDEDQGDDRLTALSSERLLQLIDACPLDRIRRRGWLLRVRLWDDDSFDVLNIPIREWMGGVRHPLAATAILYAAEEVTGEALAEDDESTRDAALTWLEVSATSSDARVAHRSAELLATLLRRRDEKGDADAAAMYEALVDRLERLNP